MTSCGCFECIACVPPGTGGIMIVGPEFSGQTPVGMTSPSLAEMTEAGSRRRAFIGIRHAFKHPFQEFNTAPMAAWRRLVWTTTRVKQKLGDRLAKRCEENRAAGIYGKIGDETICTELEPLIESPGGRRASRAGAG